MAKIEVSGGKPSKYGHNSDGRCDTFVHIYRNSAVDNSKVGVFRKVKVKLKLFLCQII